MQKSIYGADNALIGRRLLLKQEIQSKVEGSLRRIFSEYGDSLKLRLAADVKNAFYWLQPWKIELYNAAYHHEKVITIQLSDHFRFPILQPGRAVNYVTGEHKIFF